MRTDYVIHIDLLKIQIHYQVLPNFILMMLVVVNGKKLMLPVHITKVSIMDIDYVKVHVKLVNTMIVIKMTFQKKQS